MKINDLYPRKYANGEDLQGKAATLTIARVVLEAMRPGPGSPEESKPVIYFTETKKGVVMGRVLAQQIAKALAADDTDKWPGKRVTIYPESVTVAGVPRVAIRARAATNGNGETH